MDRSLPADINAERATLGSVLLERDAIIAVAPWLPTEYFYLEKHAWIYEAMLACYNRRIPPDISTVADELRRRERLDLIGGIAFLGELSAEVPTAVHIEYYARIVERTAVLRQLIEAGGKIAALGYDEREDLEVTLDKAESELFSVSQRRAGQDFVHIGKVVDSFFDQITHLQERRGEVIGVPTGYHDLDEMTGGLQPSDLIILAARPSVGKCLTARTLVDNPLTGERLSIAEWVRRRLPVITSLSAQGVVRPVCVSDWIDSGVQPCYRVRTHSGRTVEVTGHHPFLTKQGWQPLHDLKVGDRIAVPRVVPVFGNDEHWPRDLVRLLAYCIAEGDLLRSGMAFRTRDPQLLADIGAILARYFPDSCNGTEYSSSALAHWLNTLGVLDNPAQAQRFPACVWRWSRAYLAEFLRALISYAGRLRWVRGKSRLVFGTSAVHIATDVHHALIRFGLAARCYQAAPGVWRVVISGAAALHRYHEQIGWIGRYHHHSSLSRPSIATPLPSARSAPSAVQALVERARSSPESAMDALTPQPSISICAGIFAGDPIHSLSSIPVAHQNSAALSHSDIYWDTIVSIEYIGKHQVYDLTVRDGANFIAQDVFVHNTSLALSIAYNVALAARQTVGIFSLEMSREQLVQRLLAMHTNIDTQRLRTGNIRDHDLQVVMEAMGRLSEIPIFIEDTPGLSITEVRSKARRLHAESGLDLLMIDYLQLMQGGKRNDNRVQEISEISRGLKALARELNVPLIALSQLSRAVEGRTSHVPMLSDLRESGCLVGDTLVYLPDEGVYRRIDSLVGQRGFRVLALNTRTWQLEPRPVLHAFATGCKPVFKLTTRLGRSVRATANHKFLSIHGWKRLDQLAPGEWLALPRQLPNSAQPSLTHTELGTRSTLPQQAICIAPPATLELVLEMGAGPGMPHSALVPPAQQPSQEWSGAIAQPMPTHEILHPSTNDVYWDAIVAIEPDGVAETYDLTVDELHNFVANDIIVHNSIEQDADIVMFIYREELYDKETDKKGIAEIHISKHRNGPVGVVPLRFEASTTRFQNLERYRTPDGY